jgi:hypothetical protein
MATQINPGPCPPAGCPPTTEIVSIAVDKVYDSYTEDVLEIEITTVTRQDGRRMADGCIQRRSERALRGLTSGSQITVTEISRIPVGNDYQMITFLVSVPMTLTNPNDAAENADRVFTFTETVTLYCPAGVAIDTSGTGILFLQQRHYPNRCRLGRESPCVFQVHLVITCMAPVQLLVPAYGSASGIRKQQKKRKRLTV